MTKKISELTQLTAVADDDIIPLVDVSDTTMGATGTTKYIERDDLIRAPYNAMSRQAIINGNFDIWQRGTSVAMPQTTATYQADRWYDYADDDGGTAPTLTRSRQPLTSGDIANSFFYTRLATNGAGTSLGNGSLHFYAQKIENGTRNLCGLNKEVTLSFYARSSIANKKLGAYLYQDYGTGGSPSSGEVINGTSWTLTSTWTKYTHTFTTNTLVGKTFGTGYDDSLWTLFAYAWGSTNASRVGDTVAETYVGSGNIDIAQVQLNAGDEALEFNPKSYEEELRACQRYCVKLADANFRMTNYSANTMVFNMPTPTTMRAGATTPTGSEVSDWQIYTTAGAAQTGFTLSIARQASGSLTVNANKTSHGLTDGLFAFPANSVSVSTAEI